MPASFRQTAEEYGRNLIPGVSGRRFVVYNSLPDGEADRTAAFRGTAAGVTAESSREIAVTGHGVSGNGLENRNRGNIR